MGIWEQILAEFFIEGEGETLGHRLNELPSPQACLR